MANDKYDAFPQAIIILLLDLFLVCRWQRAAASDTTAAATEERERGKRRGRDARAPVREI